MRTKLTQVLGTCLMLAIFVAIVLGDHSLEAAGTKKAPLHDETVSKSIRLMLSQYATLMVAGNLDGWLALWDEEATWLPPDGPTSVGKSSIEHAFRSALALEPVRGMSMIVRDVSTEEDMAVAIGDFTEARRLPDGTVHTDGSFLTVFRRQRDGTWRIYQSSFNLNAPPAAPFTFASLQSGGSLRRPEAAGAASARGARPHGRRPGR